MKIFNTGISILFYLLVASQSVLAQGFLHAEGKYIYDGDGNEVLLKGIGTGNWMLQEGYMMQTSGIAGSMHEFKEKLIQTIGEEKTDSFYTAWLDSHFNKTDVDSMKSWGFNSIRMVLHYKWFTLSIEDEPVQGQNTWLDEGFNRINSLLKWCGDNEMYLILDMHGAPGGQGTSGEIADYDPTKPSLWESRENKDKLIALWRKIAEKYKNEVWIGGYDLINEPHWGFPNGNSPLWNLQKEITTAIREVDSNHIVIIEGNWYGNNYDGLPALWDDNMVISFHKYWTRNHEKSLDWILSRRNSRNVPLWLGETGENSNNWYTSLISLCRKHRIGWSFWPVKKPGINNVLKVDVNEDYSNLVKYWDNKAPNPGVDAAFDAMLQFAENHKAENCTVMKDVIDAMMRQPYTTESVPFKTHKTGEPIFAINYNMGRNGFAYFDNDTADFHGDGDEYQSWNQGWQYRNDGVDIEECQDNALNSGYNVGWTERGEWMEYTVDIDSTAAYTLNVRSASGGGIHIEENKSIVSEILSLPITGGYQNWRTTSFPGIILNKGTKKIRVKFDRGGANLNYFSFSNPVHVDSLGFKKLYTESSNDGRIVYLTLNKPVTSELTNVESGLFTLFLNNNRIRIDSVKPDVRDAKKLLLYPREEIVYGSIVKLSYRGSSILNYDKPLEKFSNAIVENRLPLRYQIPGLIQSEDFSFNNGMVIEDCADAGGGLDMGYANPGDYLDYPVYVKKAGNYTFDFRVASSRSSSQFIVKREEVDGIFINVDTVTVKSTGGWQNWETISSVAFLPEGRYTLRMYIRFGEFNTNWFWIKEGPVSGISARNFTEIKIYPNPSRDLLNVDLSDAGMYDKEILIYDALGVPVKSLKTDQKILKVDVSDFKVGLYLFTVQYENVIIYSSKFLIKK